MPLRAKVAPAPRSASTAESPFGIGIADEVVDDNVETGVRERNRNGAAYASAGSRHQRRFPASHDPLQKVKSKAVLCAEPERSQ